MCEAEPNVSGGSMLCARFARSIQATAIAVALALPCTARAQADYRNPGHLRLVEIIGMRVLSPSGEALGIIGDLIIDARTRRIEYIAVEPPYGRGIMSRYPVDALVAGGPREVIVDVSLLSSSAGASALAGSLQPRGFSFATAERGQGEPVVDLLEGKLHFLP
jgi:sporulation protein YlmC with PRC-barrel domain